MARYSPERKEAILKKLLPPHNLTVAEVAREEGIAVQTLYQWRDLPEKFDRWNTVFRRFNLWSKKGVLQKLFQSISSENDPEWLFIDGSIVKAHQDCCGQQAVQTKR